eukprot:scaffold142493_cov112-Phaeocystis_antarctica.AAC.4
MTPMRRSTLRPAGSNSFSWSARAPQGKRAPLRPAYTRIVAMRYTTVYDSNASTKMPCATFNDQS